MCKANEVLSGTLCGSSPLEAFVKLDAKRCCKVLPISFIFHICKTSLQQHYSLILNCYIPTCMHAMSIPSEKTFIVRERDK